MSVRVPIQFTPILDETGEIILDETNAYIYDETTGSRTVISTTRGVITTTRGVASGRVVI